MDFNFFNFHSLRKNVKIKIRSTLNCVSFERCETSPFTQGNKHALRLVGNALLRRISGRKGVRKCKKGDRRNNGEATD
jgi:hypothetical protein